MGISTIQQEGPYTQTAFASPISRASPLINETSGRGISNAIQRLLPQLSPLHPFVLPDLRGIVPKRDLGPPQKGKEV